MGEIDLSVSGECFSPRFVGFLALKVPEKCDSFSGARIAPCRIYEVFFCNLVDFPQGAILADRINLSGALRAFLLNSRSSGDPPRYPCVLASCHVFHEPDMQKTL